MERLSPGDIVRTTDSGKIYKIKKTKKIRNGGVLYLLKYLKDKSVLRLHYEDKESLLEKIC